MATDWLKVKRKPNGGVTIVPNGRKREGCVDITRTNCPRCLGRGMEVRGQFLGGWNYKKGKPVEHYVCPRCAFEWIWMKWKNL